MFHQKTAFEPAYEVSACACIIRDSQDNCELLEVKVLESYLSNIRMHTLRCICTRSCVKLAPRRWPYRRF